MIPTQTYERVLGEFLAPVARWFDDPKVSELVFNGPNEIYVERGGCLERIDARLEPDALLGALRVVSQYVGRTFDDERPILEARLPNGSRLEAVLNPIAEGGPCVAIRKHQLSSLSVDRLVELGCFTTRTAEVLDQLVKKKKNTLVSGGTGSGKTSLLRCLAGFIPAEERVVVLEDARELALTHTHVVSLETRPADVRGRGAVSMNDLFRATLRLRPDRIVMGEVRGAEAFELIQAMNSGHGGVLSTIHASSPIGALRRLETLALMTQADVPLIALRSQVAGAVDFVVQIEREHGGARRVTHVSEVCGLNGTGDYQVKNYEIEGGEVSYE